MTLTTLTRLLAVAAGLFAVVAFGIRWRSIMARPLVPDLSPARGGARAGVLYAFTQGMMPWAKESTRRHWLAYVRGIGFHVGIFGALLALLASPIWPELPPAVLLGFAALAALGGVLGAAGLVMRVTETNLRRLSTLDDHVAVVLVTIFLAATAAALVWLAWVPVMYLSAALVLVYAPLGKIRHCIYFFLSRLSFGLFIGRRGIVHRGGVRP